MAYILTVCKVRIYYSRRSYFEILLDVLLGCYICYLSMEMEFEGIHALQTLNCIRVVSHNIYWKSLAVKLLTNKPVFQSNKDGLLWCYVISVELDSRVTLMSS